jgi:signal transduction histidine kinase
VEGCGKECTSLTRGVVRIRRVAIRTELDAAVPPIRGDRVQLQQVVMNLVLNAMDAIVRADDGPREIVLKTTARNGAVEVSVSDTGIGVTPNVLAKMFDPFFTTKKHGLGMGLAIARQIVDAHRGRMWGSSNGRSRGATVCFELPAT